MATLGDFQPVRDEITGELYIPASRRPDGTWRKARKVKEGYIPQEEVPVYESKGKQWAKSQSQYPVGMSPAMIAAQEAAKNKTTNKNDKPLIPGLPPSTQQTATKKKKKKGNKPEGEVKTVTSKLAGFTIQEPTFGASAEKPKAPAAPATVSVPAAKQEKTETTGPTSDPSKRLKNLKKKLRDIETLETKVKSRELKNPDKDQLEKIKRKKEVIKEIADLEKLVTA